MDILRGSVYSPFFMKIDQAYIISIDLRPEYIAELIARAYSMGLPFGTPVKVFEGFIGKTLKDNPSDEYRLYEKWYIPQEELDWNWWNRPVMYGEAGGMISHTKIWEDAYEKDLDRIIIFEDDFTVFEKYEWNHFKELEGYDWDICLMAHNNIEVDDLINVYESEIGRENFVKPGIFYNTHNYILNKSGIKKLVENHLPILKKNIIVSDEFLSAVIASHPRSDIRALFTSNINAVATRKNYTGQSRFMDLGNSLTED